MLLNAPHQPLRDETIESLPLRQGEVRIAVEACAVCRTDLHIVDGELSMPRTPIVPGHEIVGRVIECGNGVTTIRAGDRVGVPWLGWSCGECRYCLAGRENLCDSARFTGLHIDGGFAEETVADARYCFAIPAGFDAVHAAPLLCAGLIGFRSYGFTGDARSIALYGFGAAAHIITQVAVADGRVVFAVTRDGDEASQRFACQLGAQWAGGASDPLPQPADAAIIFAPAGELVPVALRNVVKGGMVVCAGIHMSDIPSMPYEILWGERQLRSVANLTRRDGELFFARCSSLPLRTHVFEYGLDKANEALSDLRGGSLQGAAVLRIANQ